MIIISFLYYFSFILVLFLNYINVSHAGIGAISAAAAGGAHSILNGRGNYGPRPREEGTEAFIMWVLVGGVGVILIVGSGVAVYKVVKSYRKKKMEDLEKAKADLYTTNFQETQLKCELGNCTTQPRKHTLQILVLFKP